MTGELRAEEEAMIKAHELLARTAAQLSKRGIELPVFASPTITGVTLHDTDLICGVYRERMIEAQKKHLPTSRRASAEDECVAREACSWHLPSRQSSR